MKQISEKWSGRRPIMNKGVSDAILQYLKKDDSLALEELTQKLRDEGINISREIVRRKLKQIRYVSKVQLKVNIIVATKIS